MLTIEKSVEGTRCVMHLAGRLTTVNYLDVEEELRDVLPNISELVLDLDGLEYVSSAGLRVLLTLRKALGSKGSMILCNVGDTVMEVLTVTKFLSVLTIE